MDKVLEMLIKHPHIGPKIFNKLKNVDLYIVYNFIRENRGLNKNDFEAKLNRIFLDMETKPKNWNLISEFLSHYNTAREV